MNKLLKNWELPPKIRFILNCVLIAMYIDAMMQILDFNPSGNLQALGAIVAFVCFLVFIAVTIVDLLMIANGPKKDEKEWHEEEVLYKRAYVWAHLPEKVVAFFSEDEKRRVDFTFSCGLWTVSCFQAIKKEESRSPFGIKISIGELTPKLRNAFLERVQKEISRKDIERGETDLLSLLEKELTLAKE